MYFGGIVFTNYTWESQKYIFAYIHASKIIFIGVQRGMQGVIWFQNRCAHYSTDGSMSVTNINFISQIHF